MKLHIGQKPEDEQAKEAQGKPYGRQAVWETLRKYGSGTTWAGLTLIAESCQQNRRTVREYLDALVLADFAESSTPARHKFYRLLKDVGQHAPRVNKQGKIVTTGRDHIWRCMKMLSSFDADTLAAASTTDDCVVSAIDAGKYCQHLHKAGYLMVVQSATYKNKAVYKLLPSMKTGPHAPMIQRTKCVFDPNLNKIMWHEDIEP